MQNNYEAVCWGMVDNEYVVVAVGTGGSLIIMKPNCKNNSYILSKANLTLVKPLPNDLSTVLVGCGKNILVVSLKSK